MDADGTRDGFDLALTRAVAAAVRVPVIASGGAGSPAHMADAVTRGGADAALAASIYHFGTSSIAETKALFRRRGIPVRIEASA
jgi:cyclase